MLEELVGGDDLPNPVAVTARSKSRLVVEGEKLLRASDDHLKKLQDAISSVWAREDAGRSLVEHAAAFTSWLGSPEKKKLNEAHQLLSPKKKGAKRKAAQSTRNAKRCLNFT